MATLPCGCEEQLTSCDLCGGGRTEPTCERCCQLARAFALTRTLPSVWTLAHNLAIVGALYVSHAHGAQGVVAYQPHGAVEDAALAPLWAARRRGAS